MMKVKENELSSNISLLNKEIKTKDAWLEYLKKDIQIRKGKLTFYKQLSNSISIKDNVSKQLKVPKNETKSECITLYKKWNYKSFIKITTS